MKIEQMFVLMNACHLVILTVKQDQCQMEMK